MSLSTQRRLQLNRLQDRRRRLEDARARNVVLAPDFITSPADRLSYETYMLNKPEERPNIFRVNFNVFLAWFRSGMRAAPREWFPARRALQQIVFQLAEPELASSQDRVFVPLLAECAKDSPNVFLIEEKWSELVAFVQSLPEPPVRHVPRF